MAITALVEAMDKHAERTVQLRVDIPEALRIRLKTQAVRKGVTMGELLEKLVDEPLRQLELEGVEKAKK